MNFYINSAIEQMRYSALIQYYSMSTYRFKRQRYVGKRITLMYYALLPIV